MEKVNPSTETTDNDNLSEYAYNNRNGKILAGLVLITVGIIIIAQRQGFHFPEWLLSWKTLIIAIGLISGAKHNFRVGGWLIPVLIGTLFILGDYLPIINVRHYIFPGILIVIGAFLVLKPRSYRKSKYTNWKYQATTKADDDVLDVTAIFGGIKKNIISKSFRGGELTCVFGGAEVNLMQTDFEGTIRLETTQVFGGTKIILPAHWKIQSNVTTIFGGIEDKRPMATQSTDHTKILVLNGTCIFGGIEIISY